MKTHTLTSIALITTLTLPVLAQDAKSEPPPKSTSVYEGHPVLKASEVLKPAVLKGPYHLVLESVPTQGFANQYTVRTPWGTFAVRGNHLLMKRIHEFNAIAQLESVSKTAEFGQALVAAAAKPVAMVGSTLRHPVRSVSRVGSGAERFLRKAGETARRGGTKPTNTGSRLEGLIGFSKAKRQIAHQLNVDPYSDNPVLQQHLDAVARATFAGGFVVKAGMLAVSGGAGAALSAVNVSAELSGMVRDNDPIALSALNRQKLITLGVSKAGAKAFVEHPHITPSQQTQIVAQLARLGRVEGNEEFLKMTLETKDATDAEFFSDTATMMVVYHQKVSPVKSILNLHGLPAIQAQNNTLVIPLSLDYGSWSEDADRLSQAIKNFKPTVEISQRLLYVSGIISPRASKELEARGFVVSDRASIAVYK